MVIMLRREFGFPIILIGLFVLGCAAVDVPTRRTGLGHTMNAPAEGHWPAYWLLIAAASPALAFPLLFSRRGRSILIVLSMIAGGLAAWGWVRSYRGYEAIVINTHTDRG